MVDSHQSTMVMPMAPTTVARKRERTSYQLQPETLHVNHSGILPAAALSNFFKAPSTPIHSKLPSINIGESSPVTLTKSVHQKNKCLAEVIQSQLMELKLQHRCRYRRKDSNAFSKTFRQKACIGDSSANTPSKSNSSANTNTISQRKSYDDLSKVISSETKRVSGHAWNSTKTAGVYPHTKTDRVYPHTKITLQMPKVPKLPFCEQYQNLQKQSASEKMESISSERVLELTRSNTLLITQRKPTEHIMWEHSSCRQSHMDPIKFESVLSWVQSVESVQKLEGKCSQVISSPSML